MANKLTALHFDQAANLVDDPANPKAVITLFKRRVVKEQPTTSTVHVDSPDWLKKDCDYLRAKRQSDLDYLTTKRRSWA